MNKLFLVLLATLFVSCNSSALKKEFIADRYEIDSRIIQDNKNIPSYDKFLLNYGILRHRDYYNYEIEGKTFEEILELSKELLEKGINTEEVFNKNGEVDYLKIETAIEESGVVRKSPKSKKFIKAMKFNCKYTNTSDTDIVVLNTTFQMKGPFKKIITAAGYDINCLIKAHGTLKVDFILEARNIQQNLQFKKKVETPYLYLDEIIFNSEMVPSGNTVITDLEFYEECNFGGKKLTPFKVYDFYTDFDPSKQILKDGNGTTIKIDYGDAHFIIDENEEPVEIIPGRTQ
jgi:hypothetical protein